MKRIISLKGKNDFSLTFRRGKKIDSRSFRAIILRTSLPCTRIAVVAAKSVEKKAVVRNRLRRRIREYIKKYVEGNQNSYNIIFLLKKEITKTTRSGLYKELDEKLKTI